MSAAVGMKSDSNIALLPGEELPGAGTRRNGLAPALILSALGVVYGDIGTSPLYALRECFHGSHSISPTRLNILGVLSLIFWSLIVIVSIKYLSFVLRADNRGEGGILALFSLAVPDREPASTSLRKKILITLALFGAALLYGDGIITPAISVLSAIEGLNVITDSFGTFSFEPYVIPLTVAVLIALFSFQWMGTGKVGRIFGPVMLLWFLCIAVLGARAILSDPRIFSAINPIHAVRFFSENSWKGFVVLGSVFLVVTGGEALYADMGHFGRRPIQIAWFAVVLPALLLNYFGQGALLLDFPTAVVNPFYKLAPGWMLLPLVLLATVATVIASQALISGAFSLTMQAIQLGYCPRLQIEHTSPDERGQIYIPQVNWWLMLACIGLVLGFKTSSNLAGAYGVAVTMTMVITTALFYIAARRLWGWNPWLAGLICGLFALLELAFMSANLLKILAGGWFPLLIAAVVFTLMTTWKSGRRILGERLRAGSLPLQMFLDDIARHSPIRVPGTAVFLHGNAEGTPIALLHNLKHNKVLHERVVLLTVVTDEVPHVDHSERVSVEDLGNNFFRVVGHCGFMEDPNVPGMMAQCGEHGLEFQPDKTTYFLSRETLIATSRPGMAIWREVLFAFMSRNSQRATAFFRLPANRVVEMGMQVEL